MPYKHLFLRFSKVRLGEHDITRDPDCQGTNCAPPVEEFDILTATKHRSFSRTLANDIALLKLSRNIIFNGKKTKFTFKYVA